MGEADGSPRARAEAQPLAREWRRRAALGSTPAARRGTDMLGAWSPVRWCRPLEGTLVSVGTWLERQVELLIEAHRDGERVAAELLRGTGVLPGSDEELLAARRGPETAREAIARDHGYANWTDATAHADEPVDTRFEA